ncbi:hypothetical protein DFH08DRAFT_930030 [Mycena albidolilacea]|uniref:Uncharacterized protein n=1 Tax=Mycena albidolilacea TaxID=1033008 RepID=A0AAD7F3S7_9AGAR|nr:hypothetical protein DFH08DRAFT_930030 [Mycena albidolilacea]
MHPRLMSGPFPVVFGSPPTICTVMRGRKTPLPADQTTYLESVYPEWLEKRPRLTSFWSKVERGWFAKGPVELGLNLPITTVSVEESELSEEDQKRIGDTEEVMKGVIHNWINNRGQKEKKVIASNNPAAATSVPLRELDALEEEGFASLMGVSDDEETPEERVDRIKEGHRQQMALKRAVMQRLYNESPEEEKAAIEQIYLAQEPKTKKKTGKKSETSEEFQMGLDQLGPVLREFHAAVTDMTGWVGATVLVGPVPKEGGKIGTQRATAAGHTHDQAHPRWGKQVMNPLQQFGKKTTKLEENALELPETSEGVVPGNRPDGMVVEDPVRHRRRTTSRKSKHKEKSTATSGDATTSPHLLSMNTDGLLSFNNPSSDGYLPDMDDDLGSLSAVENDSSLMDWTLIDPVLRRMSGAAGGDASDAGNDEPCPNDALGRPLFELRSLSADSLSQESLAPFTQGFQFGKQWCKADPDGFSISPAPSSSSARGAPAAPVPPPAPAPPAAARGAPAAPATPTRGFPSVCAAPSAFTAATARGGPAAPATPVTLVMPSPPAARGVPAVPATPTHRPGVLARSSPASFPGSYSAVVTTPSPLRFVHTSGTMTPPSELMTPLTKGPTAAPIPATAASSLTPDDFPQSRPMSNLPPMPKPPGSRGHGGHAAVREEDGDKMDQEMGGRTSAHNNTVAPVSRERMKEIRVIEKKCDVLAAQATKERDHGIFRFGPPPAGHKRPLPHGPAVLGARRIEVPIKLASGAVPPPPWAPSARERHAPVRVPVNVVDSGKENTTGGDGGKGRKQMGEKRKAHAENVDVEVEGRSKKKYGTLFLEAQRRRTRESEWTSERKETTRYVYVHYSCEQHSSRREQQRHLYSKLDSNIVRRAGRSLHRVPAKNPRGRTGGSVVRVGGGKDTGPRVIDSEPGALHVGTDIWCKWGSPSTMKYTTLVGMRQPLRQIDSTLRQSGRKTIHKSVQPPSSSIALRGFTRSDGNGRGSGLSGRSGGAAARKRSDAAGGVGAGPEAGREAGREAGQLAGQLTKRPAGQTGARGTEVSATWSRGAAGQEQEEEAEGEEGGGGVM